MTDREKILEEIDKELTETHYEMREAAARKDSRAADNYAEASFALSRIKDFITNMEQDDE